MTRQASTPRLSRSGVSSPLGKFTAEFPKFKGPEDTLDEANRLAREAGMTLTEWLRTLVMVRVHGLDTVTRMQEDRLRVVAGMGNESVSNRNPRGANE